MYTFLSTEGRIPDLVLRHGEGTVHLSQLSAKELGASRLNLEHTVTATAGVGPGKDQEMLRGAV